MDYQYTRLDTNKTGNGNLSPWSKWKFLHFSNLSYCVFSGILFAFQYLVKNIEWLDENLQKYHDSYILFDFPGQVELYTHDQDVATLCEHLEKDLSFRVRHLIFVNYFQLSQLVCVHLVDSYVLCDIARFISASLLSLNGMYRLSLPHLNVISKVDLLPQYGQPCLHFSTLISLIIFFLKLVIPLSSLANVTDADSIKDLLKPFEQEEGNTPSSSSISTSPSTDAIVFPPALPFKNAPRYARLNERLIVMVEDYALVGFHFLTIKEPTTFASLLAAADKSNGYVFSNKAALHSQRSLFAITDNDDDDVEENSSWRTSFNAEELYAFFTHSLFLFDISFSL